MRWKGKKTRNKRTERKNYDRRPSTTSRKELIFSLIIKTNEQTTKRNEYNFIIAGILMNVFKAMASGKCHMCPLGGVACGAFVCVCDCMAFE